MPKIKTHSGAKKRFKLSKNGKVIRAHANKSHILNKKTTKRKRACVRPRWPIRPMWRRSSACFLTNKEQRLFTNET